MKRNNLYLIAIGLGLTVATACNNDKKMDDKTDTVVVEKNVTEESSTPANNAATEPATDVTVDKNGTSVHTKSTDVNINKDSISFKK